MCYKWKGLARDGLPTRVEASGWRLYSGNNNYSAAHFWIFVMRVAICYDRHFPGAGILWSGIQVGNSSTILQWAMILVLNTYSREADNDKSEMGGIPAIVCLNQQPSKSLIHTSVESQSSSLPDIWRVCTQNSQVKAR